MEFSRTHILKKNYCEMLIVTAFQEKFDSHITRKFTRLSYLSHRKKK